MNTKELLNQKISSLRQHKTIDLSRHGVDLHLTLRKLTGKERDNFENSHVTVSHRSEKGKTVQDAILNFRNIRARFAVLVLGDETGKRVYEQDSDAEWVGENWAGDLLDFIFTEGCKHNGMKTGEEETTREQDIKGN